MTSPVGRFAPLSLAGDEQGAGPPVVLVHGFFGSSRVWDDVVAGLAASSRVVRLDLRGHGRSAGPADPAAYTLTLAAADLAHSVQKRDLQQPVVVAHSFGGTVALWAALRYGGVFGSLVLVGSFAYGLPREQAALLRRRLGEVERIGVRRYWDAHAADRLRDPELGARFAADAEFDRIRREEAYAVSAAACSGFGREMLRSRSFAEWLWQLDLPVALLVGEHDEAMLPAMRELAAVLPRADLTVLAGCGHNPMMAQPERFLAELKNSISTSLH